MKRIFFSLLILLATSALKAQDTATVKQQYQYAFVYYYYDEDIAVNCVGIYYEDGTREKLPMPWRNALATNIPSKNFDTYIQAFHSLENKGYQLAIPNATILNEATPYYLFRRKKQ